MKKMISASMALAVLAMFAFAGLAAKDKAKEKVRKTSEFQALIEAKKAYMKQAGKTAKVCTKKGKTAPECATALTAMETKFAAVTAAHTALKATIATGGDGGGGDVDTDGDGIPDSAEIPQCVNDPGC